MPTNGLLITLAIGLGVGLCAGWWLGSGHTTGKYEAQLHRMETEQRQLLEHTAQNARAAALIESDARAEIALLHASQAATAREIRLKGQINALENNRPECHWTDVSVRLLNDAVTTANGGDAPCPTNGMHDVLP